MTVATAAAGIKTLLEAVNCRNVKVEQDATFDKTDSLAGRTYGDRIHFWLIEYNPLPNAVGLGWFESRLQFRIRGFMGIAQDNPAEGTVSRVTFGNLLRAVVDQLTTPGNRTPGSSLGSELPAPSAITKTDLTVGDRVHPCHTAEILWTVIEE